MLVSTVGNHGLVRCWDIRDISGPALSINTGLATAGDVSWNPIKPFVLASTHGGKVRVWDTRRSHVPLLSVQAHSSKGEICMAWAYSDPNTFVTCWSGEPGHSHSPRLSLYASLCLCLCLSPLCLHAYIYTHNNVND